jgi:hypothetical protein
MTDTSLVVGDLRFFTHHDRALYIGTLNADRQQWLEKNKDAWQRVENVQQELAPVSSATNGTSSNTVLKAERKEEFAPKTDRSTRRELLKASGRDYHDKGWVSLCLEGKRPMGKAWQKRTLADQIPEFEEDSNIGILLGEPSGGLVRLDYDLPQVPGLHEELFPSTLMFGRPSAPATGLLVFCKGLKTTNFILPKSMKDDRRLPAHGDNERSLVVLQILSTGAQTMAPPSVHPITKEEVRWESLPSEISQFTTTELLRLAGIEAMLMVVRHFWPVRGTRNEAAMALARVLLEVLEETVPAEDRRIDLVDRLVTLVAMAGGDGEASRNGKQRAAATLEKMKKGEETTGLPQLVELLGLPDDAITCLRKWVGVRAEASDGRVQIVFSDVDDLRVLNETQQALLSAKAPIFQRGGQLAHVFRLDREDKVVDQNGKTTWSRPAGSLVIKPVGVDRLRLYLSQHIRFVIPKKVKEGD